MLSFARLKKPLALTAASGLGLIGFITVAKLAKEPWPLVHANLWLAAAAVLLAVLSLLIRFAGWQRLFARGGRPDGPAWLGAAVNNEEPGPVVIEVHIVVVVEVREHRKERGVVAVYSPDCGRPAGVLRTGKPSNLAERKPRGFVTAHHNERNATLAMNQTRDIVDVAPLPAAWQHQKRQIPDQVQPTDEPRAGVGI